MSKTAAKRKAVRELERRQRREAKRERGLVATPVDQLEVATRVLIVCEGEKTEPLYLRSFPVNSEVAEVDIEGEGKNTDSLVDKAVELADDDERGPYDHVWVVFDRDSFPATRFNRAIESINTLDSRRNVPDPGGQSWAAAYCNESFELWYLLHFHFCDAALSRATYRERLTDCIGEPYKKNDARMYDRLLALQPAAIRNAVKLLARYPHHNPETDNPSTTVHHLVEFLNGLLERR